MKHKKQSKKVAYHAWEWLGFLLIDLSLLLAFTIRYRHYYEILVIGFALVLYELDRKFLVLPNYIRMYSVLFRAGIIGDLVLGLGLGLWHYTFPHLYEYIVLYSVEYPIAGIVMIQSYVFLKRGLRAKPRFKTISAPTYKTIIGALVVITVVLLALTVARWHYQVTAVLFYLTISLLATSLLSYRSMLRKHDNLLEELHQDPVKTLCAIIATTYFFCFVEEGSNGYVHQWIYSNFSYAHAQIFNFPAAVLPFWPLLTIVPVAVCYAVVPVKLGKNVLVPKTIRRSPRGGFMHHLPPHVYTK